MKIRKDFVTNSSSSSFIIGKENTTESIDDIFIKVRDCYLSFINNLNKVKDLALKSDMFTYNESTGKLICKPNISTEEELDFNSKCLKECEGVGIYYYFKPNLEWTKAKTYKEYLSYFKKDEEPFTITDISTISEFDSYVDYNILYENFLCAENIVIKEKDLEYEVTLSNKEYECESCQFFQTEKCKEFRKRMREDRTIKSAVTFLGKYLVKYDQYMIFHIAKKLEEISEYTEYIL